MTFNSADVPVFSVGLFKWIKMLSIMYMSFLFWTLWKIEKSFESNGCPELWQCSRIALKLGLDIMALDRWLTPRCSLTLVLKCLPVAPKYVALHPRHENLYISEDLMCVSNESLNWKKFLIFLLFWKMKIGCIWG